ncbi:MAG TPA: DNA-binding response regulator [Elusimicrobia bacterium]|nr:DNA-binding response regulator [Elusimicrobiota bacterium]
MKNKTGGKIRIFLVDDHPVVRDGVRACLSAQAAFEVVGEASDDKEALRKMVKARPDIIILDISLPGLDGGELARRMRQAVPGARIIVFSIHASREYVVRMAHCGAHGYVMKDRPPSELVEAIRQVHKGGLFFPPEMADAILAPAEAGPARGAVLTPRETEVLSLLAEGLANKQVARKLGISVRTAETHREHISHKLNILTVSGLTKYAIQHGLTSLKTPAE